MTDDLYFIPLIAHALQQTNTDQALSQAFEEIISKGRQPRYRRGFEQFGQFMDAAHRRAEAEHSTSLKRSFVRELMTELATNGFEDSEGEKQAVLDLIYSHSPWQREYEQLLADIKHLQKRSPPLLLSVLRDGKSFRTMEWEKVPGRRTIEQVVPGHYALSVATGWVIWQGDLTEGDLIWTAAFPGAPLDLAAATGETQTGSTRQFRLLDGEITLQVFAGLETGRLDITVNLPGNS